MTRLYRVEMRRFQRDETKELLSAGSGLSSVADTQLDNRICPSVGPSITSMLKVRKRVFAMLQLWLSLCVGGGWIGLHAPAHPFARILWPHVTCSLASRGSSFIFHLPHLFSGKQGQPNGQYVLDLNLARTRMNFVCCYNYQRTISL